MIAISGLDFSRYGCPYCGRDAYKIHFATEFGVSQVTCQDCKKDFLILSYDIKKSPIGFMVKDSKGDISFEYPELQPHPRQGIPAHGHIHGLDIHPEQDNAEFWNFVDIDAYIEKRVIFVGIRGLVTSRAAGRRLHEMVKDVLGKEEPYSCLEPLCPTHDESKWTQYGFRACEFNISKLQEMVKANNDIITKDILIECKLQLKGGRE